jgi:hypothetical protein
MIIRKNGRKYEAEKLKDESPKKEVIKKKENVKESKKEKGGK